MNTDFVFLRHANASQGDVDFDRPLTDQGIARCHETAAWLKGTPPFDLVISSSAVRALETVQYLLNHLGQSPEIISFDEIYEHHDDVTRQMVALLYGGAATLKDLLHQDEHGAWERYVDDALEVIIDAVEMRQAKRVLVVGHLHIINALGYRIDPTQNALLDLDLGCAEGFELSEGKLSLLVRED